MKIEIVSFTGDSGLADYSASLARALAKKVNTRVITANSFPQRFDEMGFKVERVFRRSRHYPIDFFRFIIGVIKRRPEWVIVQGPLKFPLFDALAIRIFRLFGISTCITVHDVLPHYPHRLSHLEYGFYYRSFDRVIVHSHAANKGVEKLGVNVQTLQIPHGIYDIFNLTDISQSSARSKINEIKKNEFVLLFFGHLEPRKGLMEFISCAEYFNKKGDNSIRFVIAGASGLDKHGKNYIDRLEKAKLLDNITVHDHRVDFENVENYFSASDVIVLPYLEGTTSGVLKLALAFGKPVIVTRVGDFPEQIPTGAGIVVDNDENLIDEVCSAIEEMKLNYKKYSHAMKAAGDLAQWPDIADKTIKYLK